MPRPPLVVLPPEKGHWFSETGKTPGVAGPTDNGGHLPWDEPLGLDTVRFSDQERGPD